MVEFFLKDFTMLKKYNKLMDEKGFFEEDLNFDHI